MAGTEPEQLVGAIERQRATFRWKVDGLDASGLRHQIATSTLTLGGLLKHLALIEDYVFTTKLTGEPIGAPWDALGRDENDDEWEFTSSFHDDADELYSLWDNAVARSRARLGSALSAGELDQDVHVTTPHGRHLNLRRILCDLLEEYSRHTGHADLLREAIDGRVGEDPPEDWRPRSSPEPPNLSNRSRSGQ